MLITYGDGIRREGEAPLATLRSFLNEELSDTVSAVHLLPMFPYTSDDGFSVTDFKAINPELGDWGDIGNLGKQYDLMFDAVINHVSKSSRYFKEYAAGNPHYRGFFIEADPDGDYSTVIRPRTLPLLTKFDFHGDEVSVDHLQRGSAGFKLQGPGSINGDPRCTPALCGEGRTVYPV